jgi:hypothetical protein
MLISGKSKERIGEAAEELGANVVLHLLAGSG